MTPWTIAHQAPLSMRFSSQEYWSGLPFPSPEDLPDPEIEPESPALQADSLPPASPLEAHLHFKAFWKPISTQGPIAYIGAPVMLIDVF